MCKVKAVSQKEYPLTSRYSILQQIFYSGLQLFEWGPFTIKRVICFTQSTDLNIVVVQSCSHVWLFATLWTSAQQASLSFTTSQSLFRFMSIELMILFSYLILCHPFLLLPSVYPIIRVFSSESALCIRWPTFWSFSFSTSPSNKYSGLISFKTDLFDLFAVQAILKILL